jgi:putative endonuclease
MRYILCYIGATEMTASTLTRWRLQIFERSLKILDRWAVRASNPTAQAAHLQTGLRGEDAAYFYLRRQGYVIVARRWKSAKQPGDIDLIGWDGEWLCFIEVKTRTRRDSIAAEVAVDKEKRETLRRMARQYLRNFANIDQIPVRFDVLSVYMIGEKPEFELFKAAFNWN